MYNRKEIRKHLLHLGKVNKTLPDNHPHTRMKPGNQTPCIVLSMLPSPLHDKEGLQMSWTRAQWYHFETHAASILINMTGSCQTPDICALDSIAVVAVMLSLCIKTILSNFPKPCVALETSWFLERSKQREIIKIIKSYSWSRSFMPPRCAAKPFF